MFSMVIETGPELHVVSSPTRGVKVTDLELMYKSFALNFLQFQFWAKPSMDFIHVWHDDRTLSEILLSQWP